MIRKHKFQLNMHVHDLLLKKRSETYKYGFFMFSNLGLMIMNSWDGYFAQYPYEQRRSSEAYTISEHQEVQIFEQKQLWSCNS
jgi:hypothetical protein